MVAKRGPLPGAAGKGAVCGSSGLNRKDINQDADDGEVDGFKTRVRC